MDGRLILVLILALHQLCYCNAEATTLEVLAHNMNALQDVFNEKLGHLSELEERLSYAEKKLSYIINTETKMLERIANAEKRLYLVQTDERKTQKRVDTLESRLILLQRNEYNMLKRIQRIYRKKGGLNNNEADEKDNGLLLMKTGKSLDSAVHTGAKKQVLEYTDEGPEVVAENLTTSELRTKKRITNPGIRQNRSVDRKKVAFTAKLENTIPSVSPGQILLFDTIVYNEGNSFDLRTSAFTCPLGGTYYFSASAETSDQHSLSLALTKDGVVLVNLFVAFDNSQSTTGVVTRCEAGQKIWLRVNYGSLVYGSAYTSFTGFVLWGDDVGTSS